MARKHNAGQGVKKGLHWSALAAGLSVAGLYLLFVVQFGAKVLSKIPWSSPASMPLFVVLTLALAGTVIAWRWEAAGGLMALLGGMAIVALIVLGHGSGMALAGLLLALPLLVAGILYLACRGWTAVTVTENETVIQKQAGKSTLAVA
jgi:hypothetical protein